jgi:hypothetical protein
MTCWLCDQPKRSALCAKHLREVRGKDRNERIRHMMAGQCTTCRDDAEPGRSYCRYHLDQYAAAQRRYAARKKNRRHDANASKQHVGDRALTR